MSQYFDKDFFKFLIGFVSILIISLVIMVVLREYQVRVKVKTETQSVNATTPQE